jgi:hypothetical protein
MSSDIARGNIFGLMVVTATLDPASIAANVSAEQTFTVPDLRAADVIVSVTKPTASAGAGIVGWRVTAANTVGITFMNTTGSAIDPGAEVYKIVVARPGTNNGLPTTVAF